MTVKGCVFDFSGTIFRIEPAGSWLRGALATAGINASEAEVARYAERLDAVGALPGGRPPQDVPRHLSSVWDVRDEDARFHRAAYVGVAREVDLPWPELYGVLYDRHMAPVAWAPYPDTVEVLSALRERGLRVAVLSNPARDVLMVGDDAGADGGATSVGCAFHQVEHLPVERRPNGLRPVLDLVG